MNGKEQRRQDWQARIASYRASGLTMKAWCTANQCSVEQLKYWLYKFKRSTSQVTPKPLVMLKYERVLFIKRSVLVVLLVVMILIFGCQNDSETQSKAKSLVTLLL
ncbi:IS66 family insertion sequence element accessory protein TnpA [Paenibacillus sp. MMO-177]|uniref:IS66 family insertion sequence element accessory protein TnpA n=1 Tax=Paenibacillus sp. MMO-177 TaxID=3081289 RepID=UPI003016D674